MPMIRHQLKRENRNMVFLQSFRQDSLKSRIIVVFPKDLQPAISTIECMVSPSCFICSSWSWHQMSQRSGYLQLNESGPEWHCLISGLGLRRGTHSGNGKASIVCGWSRVRLCLKSASLYRAHRDLLSLRGFFKTEFLCLL